MRRARLLVLWSVASLVAGGCSDDDGAPPPPSEAPPASTLPPAVTESDGQLTVGLLLPRGANTIGDPMIAAARRAVDDIRLGGGEISLVEADEGADATEAEAGIQALLDEGVDAIVGPSSSTTALGSLGVIVDAGVVSCSPTASSLLLDDFPDRDLFFRSIASDSLQAQAIARRTEFTGGRSVAIAYLDDIYGRGLLDAARDALDVAAIAVVSEIPITPGAESLGDQAESALAEDPDVVIVLADNIEGPRMLAAMDSSTAPGDGDEVPTIIVNDAIRRPASAEAILDVGEDVRSRIQGVSPTATPPESSELTGNFSAQAYNCVTAIALAARQAGSDLPAEIALEMVAVSTVGTPCADYAECAAVIDDDLNADYQGPDGLFDLDQRGDISRARFDVFGFDENGVDVGTTTMVVP
jgi:branched-chain amino acid transport system substrate-binding protein